MCTLDRNLTESDTLHTREMHIDHIQRDERVKSANREISFNESTTDPLQNSLETDEKLVG